MSEAQTLTIHVFRYRPDRPDERGFAAYEVPCAPGLSIMDALRYAQERVDPSLAFDCSCRIGICKACAVRANGQVVMACSTVAQDGMHIEPVNYKDVRRDLVVRPSIQPATVDQILASLSMSVE